MKKNTLLKKTLLKILEIINKLKKYKKIFFIILLPLIALCFYLYYRNHNSSIKINSTEYFNNSGEQDFLKFIENNVFYNENNEKIDHKSLEIDEQRQAFNFIKGDDIVLELGGRYGSVSVVINKIVNNKNAHVVVDPDLNIIPALEKNREANQSSFTILPKFISNKNKKIVYDGYGTRIEDNNDNNSNDDNNKISYEQFKTQFPQNFNVLIADCEGCLGEFLDMMGNDFNYLNKVIFEADQPHLCDYNKIKEKLINSGFKLKDNNSDFRFVYIKE